MAITITLKRGREAAVGLRALLCQRAWEPRAQGQAQFDGTLDGEPYTIIGTHGRGQGSTDNHYLYFQHGGRWYYVFVGYSFPAGRIAIRILTP